MVGETDGRDNRPSVPVRKVVMPNGRKQPTGIYDEDGTPAAAIVPGYAYRAKFSGTMYDVRARSDGFMDWNDERAYTQ